MDEIKAQKQRDESLVEKFSQGIGIGGIVGGLTTINDELKSKNTKLEELTDEMQIKYRQMSESVNTLNADLARLKVIIISFVSNHVIERSSSKIR
jgi:hypothetical protein